jgi:uncharacterized protein YjiS (DUF1127 family)
MTYVHIHPTTGLTAGSSVPSVIAKLAAAVHTEIDRLRKRRRYRQMLTWDNHRLSDMGLSRDDISFALWQCGGRI